MRSTRLDAVSLAAAAALRVGLRVDEKTDVVSPPSLGLHLAPSRAAMRTLKIWIHPPPHHGRDEGKRGGEWGRIGFGVCQEYPR
jgi:hypothetical protein